MDTPNIPPEVRAALAKRFPKRRITLTIALTNNNPTAKNGCVSHALLGIHYLGSPDRANDGLVNCVGCAAHRLGVCRNTSCGGYVTLIEPTMEAVESLVVAVVARKLEGN